MGTPGEWVTGLLEGGLGLASDTQTALDLDLRDVEATLEPLERATMLPPRAFVDPGVFEWELERIFGGWVCVGHASLLTEPGSYLMREIGDDSIVVMAMED